MTYKQAKDIVALDRICGLAQEKYCKETGCVGCEFNITNDDYEEAVNTILDYMDKRQRKD